MRVLELGNVNWGSGAGGSVPPGDYIGFAIGPDSLISACKVDGVTLVPGMVLPMQCRTPKVSRCRGPRTGTQPTSASQTLVDQVVNRLQLIAYECGDVLVPTVPERAPVRDYYAADITGLAWTRAIRLATQGRRMGQLSLWVTATGGLQCQWMVQGIRYLPFDRAGGALVDAPWFGELQAADATTVEPTAPAITGSAYPGSTIHYWGGTDSAEFVDEVELWVRDYAPSAGTISIRAELSAWGELVKGGG